MIYKTRGIVLNQHKYGESSLIVHVYTEKFGRQSYIVKGGHSKKSRSRSNLFRPLFLLDMEVYHKEGKNIQTLKEIRLTEPFVSLPYDIYKSTLALFLAEVLAKVLREEEANPSMFEFLFHSIRFLDLTQETVANFHLFFLIRLSRYLGFYPQLNHSEKSPCFDLLNGRFISEESCHSNCLNRVESEAVYSLLNTSLDFVSSLKISGKVRGCILDGLLSYYSFHLDAFSSVKSLAVLREIFS